MKTPLFAVACAGIGAAGIFSYTKISTHQAELDETNDRKQQIIVVENSYASMQKEYDEEKENLKKAEDALNETKAEIELKESQKLTLKRTLKDLDNKIATQEEKIEEVEQLIAKVKEAFKGQDVALDQVPQFVEQLNEERKDLEKKSEELAIAIEEVQKKLDTNNADLADLNKRESERIASLRQNSISSLITAVNNNWGFVIIKPHPQALINEDSQLIIVRGAQHIGRLNINAVEANRVIADIDYDSLVAGARVRSGDRVILAKANSR
ncbi:hypothetical protein [Rubritalea tangerina]|uniref:DUF3552 domain-containing protein n=1 Tax=Rubritalea tangerina TaxID=430798 RepID=A0ABW4ZDV6_9BACT